MALVKNAGSAAPKPVAGQFEGMDDATAVNSAARAATAERAPSVQQTAAAGVEASMAVAKISAGAVSAPAKKFEYVLLPLACALKPVDVAALTRLKSGSGNIKDENGVDYGRYVEMQLLSYHDSWTISPGSDNDESKDKVRYSLDGKTIDGTGESVDEYIAFIKSEAGGGYNNANKKQYLILAGILSDCEKSKEKVSSVVQVSLAPKSGATFVNYHMQLSVQVMQSKRDIKGAEMIRLDATAASATIKGSSKDYTKLVVTGAAAV